MCFSQMTRILATKDFSQSLHSKLHIKFSSHCSQTRLSSVAEASMSMLSLFRYVTTPDSFMFIIISDTECMALCRSRTSHWGHSYVKTFKRYWSFLFLKSLVFYTFAGSLYIFYIYARHRDSRVLTISSEPFHCVCLISWSDRGKAFRQPSR